MKHLLCATRIQLVYLIFRCRDKMVPRHPGHLFGDRTMSKGRTADRSSRQVRAETQQFPAGNPRPGASSIQNQQIIKPRTSPIPSFDSVLRPPGHACPHTAVRAEPPGKPVPSGLTVPLSTLPLRRQEGINCQSPGGRRPSPQVPCSRILGFSLVEPVGCSVVSQQDSCSSSSVTRWEPREVLMGLSLVGSTDGCGTSSSSPSASISTP